ncbi:hypothetical protein C900_00943 [Fulvivirga imtechensis AK7]|uniref:Lipoprotein n=1 Tax=Fulvivirga imtechensis AK7 TaxID=1237149 RepID=L8JGZ7_9BACT|nr:hypothetical protein [Fulvivirga imtechensis]ELR68105.1 hypothetical protein C900_00943 [Fulvivirga imtechensis AK7]
MRRLKYIVILVAMLYGCGDGGKMNREKMLEAYDKADKDTVLIDEHGNEIRVIKDSTVDILDVLIPKRNPTRLVNESLNGKVIYNLDSIGSKVSIVNMDYSNEYFIITINNDTIREGEFFIADIAGGVDEIDVQINGEKEQLKLSDLPYGYKIKADELGVQEFSGVVTTPEKKYPFEYKYVVVAADSLDRIQE